MIFLKSHVFFPKLVERSYFSFSFGFQIPREYSLDSSQNDRCTARTPAARRPAPIPRWNILSRLGVPRRPRTWGPTNWRRPRPHRNSRLDPPPGDDVLFSAHVTDIRLLRYRHVRNFHISYKKGILASSTNLDLRWKTLRSIVYRCKHHLQQIRACNCYNSILNILWRLLLFNIAQFHAIRI